MTRPALDAMTLRELGETADGGRYRDLKLVIETLASGTRKWRVITDSELDAANAGQFEYITDIPGNLNRPPLAEFDEVVFFKGDVRLACCAPPTDALFWTDSSMEKFVFPYYEQLRIFPESYMETLKRDFRDPTRRALIVAVKHDDPSRSKILTSGSCPPPPQIAVQGLYYLVPTFVRWNNGSPWLTPEDFGRAFDAGLRAPRRREKQSTAKQSTAKQSTAKQSTAKQSAAKQSAAKQSAAKKRPTPKR